MGFDMKTWSNPVSLDANNLNRIEQGIKNAHDTLDITNGEVSNLQINQTRIIEELNALTSSAPSILKTLTQIETLLANNDISTILNSTEAFLLKGSQTLTAEELTQVYKNLKLDSFLKLTNIKVNNKSVVHGSEVNIPLDSSLDINSDNAISNRAVASALKNINLSGKIPTKLSDLEQDDSYMTVSKAEKDFWNSPGIISESDPTVPDWAKTPNKPKYTYAEIIDAPTVYDDNQYLKNGAGYTTETRATDIATTVFNTNITTFETTKVTPFNNRISIIEGQLPVLSELLNNHNHDTLYSKLNHTHQDLKDYTDNTVSSVTDATLSSDSKTLTITKRDGTSFNFQGGSDLSNYVTKSTAQTIDGAKAFTGTVGNIQTDPGIYLGLDQNTGAENANMAIVSANTAAYIDMGRPNVDYDFRIIKWNTSDNRHAQLVYGGNAAGTITIPQATGVMALTNDLAAYLPLSGGTMTGPLVLSGGDATTGVGNIQLDTTGQITAKGTTQTLFGRTSASNLILGHSSHALTIRGSATRPTYNGNELALKSDAAGVVSKGAQAPQQNRTQAYEDVYTYNTYSKYDGLMPTYYTSVIGFGDGTTGTVELAGCWTSEMGLWYRALRDCNDNWWPWQQIITQRGGTIASGYSLTIEGSIIV